MFLVGDVVRIVKIATDPRVTNWTPEMDRTIGMTGVIIHIHTEYGTPVVVIHMNSNKYYPIESIELELDPERLNNTFIRQTQDDLLRG